jgi:hypothetical protein
MVNGLLVPGSYSLHQKERLLEYGDVCGRYSLHQKKGLLEYALHLYLVIVCIKKEGYWNFINIFHKNRCVIVCIKKMVTGIEMSATQPVSGYSLHQKKWVLEL